MKIHIGIRIDALREAAEIARTLRPPSACSCGSYVSITEGTENHQPGCVRGECLSVAEEIDARADDLEDKYGATVDFY